MSTAQFPVSARWRLASRWLPLVLMAAAAGLIIYKARSIDWTTVAVAARDYHPTTLLLGTALAAVAYAMYASFDVLGNRYIDSPVRSARAAGIAFVSYACNQNFGALLGTVGLRLRLYSKLGLDYPDISRIIVLSVITNWLGYCALAGTLFGFGLVSVPTGWGIGNNLLQAGAWLLLLAVVGYLVACAWSRQRTLYIRDQRIELPALRLAASQLAASTLHWLAAGAVLYVLLHAQIDFFSVLGTLLLTSIAVVIAHIPGGIGIIEGVFVAVLSPRMQVAEILAAVLTFRAIFYLGALLVAGLVYLALETNAPATALDKASKA